MQQICIKNTFFLKYTTPRDALLWLIKIKYKFVFKISHYLSDKHVLQTPNTVEYEKSTLQLTF